MQKKWFIHATFKIIWYQFTQCLSIHAFIKSDNSFKQVLLMFVVMSGELNKDYNKVFKTVKSVLPTTVVKTVIIDFEAAMWSTLPLVFPDVTILGCYFHWAQAVWLRVQDLGLQVAYNTDEKTHKYICKLLSLPYLPSEHIGAIFTALWENAATEPLKELTSYINSTWISSNVWPIIWWYFFWVVHQDQQ